MKQIKNAPALLAAEVYTIHVVFGSSLRNDTVKSYKYVTSYHTQVGDWVVVPVPAPVIRCESVASILQRYTPEYTGTPMLSDGKMPAMALVVAVDDSTQISQDDDTAYAWVIQSGIPKQQYADLLETNTKIVALVATSNKNKQKAAARAAAKEMRDAILAELPSRTARELAVLTRG